MDFDSDLQRAFSPETVAILEQAFEDVWKVLQAHNLGQSMMAASGAARLTAPWFLAADGITYRQQLRSQALGTIQLKPR